jgi:hypothetical protein
MTGSMKSMMLHICLNMCKKSYYMHVNNLVNDIIIINTMVFFHLIML